MFEAHDALLCVAEGTYVAENARRRSDPNYWLKPANEMRALFSDLPEACDNTLVIAQRCAYMPTKHAPILPAFPTTEGRAEADELRLRAEQGLEERLRAQFPDASAPGADDTVRQYRERLEFELDVINRMEYPGYFLIVADFIQWAKSQGIPVGPGRGSGAGSVVAWALTITDLDPLKFGLLFERFLNPERVSMPDFDIDFCQDRRDEVIEYVQQKYGTDKVAQIITFGKLQARAVLRDVGRVLQMPYPQVDRICKLVPNNPANPVTLEEAIEAEPQFRELLYTDESVSRLVAIARRLEGLYRHASTHAAGVVIGDRPLDELVPMYRDPRSQMPVTQFNMKDVEAAGLVKFDFLGLKTLTVLSEAERLLREQGVDIDLANLPLDDAKTYEMLSRGEGTGVFQLEGSGMRDMLRRLKPDRFEDLIAVVALYRPGPMQNIPAYIRRKHGEEAPEYPHEKLKPILEETYGIMIYQEQVMQSAQILAGYTLGGADLLRRAMGKKIKEEMDAQRQTFVDGCVANGVPSGQASSIFDLIDRFAGYGFNKSHAAAYALVAYQTAYLKANYPVEFFAASMNLDIGNPDKLSVFRQELQRLDIELLPPDINRSDVRFAVDRTGDGSKVIRYGLAAIKNVGAQAMRSLVECRETDGQFGSLSDLTKRIDPRALNKRQLENLIRAGAFDCIEPNRRKLFDSVETIMRHAVAAAGERDSSQVNLFADDSASMPGMTLADCDEWSSADRLKHEFEAIGFYLSAHPLDAYAVTLARLDVVPFAQLARALRETRRTRLKLAGIVVGRQERNTRNGNRVGFITLSDPSGQFEVTAFSEILGVARQHLDTGTALLVTVDVREDGDSFRLTATEIQPLEKAAANTAAGLRIFMGEKAPLDGLKSILVGQGRGRGKITLVLEIGGEFSARAAVNGDFAADGPDLANPPREVEVALPGGYAISPAARAAIKQIPGIVDVHDV